MRINIWQDGLDHSRPLSYRLSMRTVQELLKNADETGEYLLRTALKKTRSELLLDLKAPVSNAVFRQFNRLTKAHAAGMPVQYVVGEAWFFGLKFKVTPKVLIPRPETELMVERALALAAEHQSCSVVDVGTGSGAIAIAIAKNCSTSVHAIDISSAALAIARANAHALDAHITFSKTDARKKFPLPKTDHIIITANLPYLSDARMESLSPEVRLEPHLALYGGPDGLDFYRALLPNIAKKNITALFEIDPEQKTKLASLVAHEFPNSEIIFHLDLHGDIRLAEITF